MAVNTKKVKKQHKNKVGLSRTWERVGEQYKESEDVHYFVTQPAVVKTSLSRTINLGQYNSVKLEVGVEIPCYVEELDLALDEAKDICENRLSALVEELGVE